MYIKTHPVFHLEADEWEIIESAICQKITGKSALHWIEYYAVHEILLLLNNPALTLTEVTDRMHFPAPPMLTRYPSVLSPARHRRIIGTHSASTSSG
ncbi:MAG: hypothetical protein IJ654_10680 [Bacteroidales bacterium]|nr:hypothetical protein [Bacteroidales bacterium]MBR1578002.1 hypothetical protein [Bacteroidales bacterium]